MTFGDAIKSGFKKYFDFSGRASRSELWWWTLFCFLIGFGCAILDMSIGWGNNSSKGNGPLATFSTVSTLLPSLAVSVRRLHDSDRSGWWLWGTFLGWIFAVILIALAAVGDKSNSGALDIVAGTAGLSILGFSIALIVFYCLPGSPGVNRYGPPVVVRQDLVQKTRATYPAIGVGNGLNASEWVLSGFDSVGNIVRLEFDVSGRRSQTLIIGRNRDVCDLVIVDDGVSRRHAEISVSSAGVFIRDLESANGTFLNGQKLTGDPLHFPANGTLAIGPIELSIFGS
jgi:uncharacterized membrane protein YhaH (DUF805 family)